MEVKVKEIKKSIEYERTYIFDKQNYYLDVIITVINTPNLYYCDNTVEEIEDMVSNIFSNHFQYLKNKDKHIIYVVECILNDLKESNIKVYNDDQEKEAEMEIL